MTPPIELSETTAIWVLLFGLSLKLAGFAVRDELALRVLVVAGFTIDACYYFLRPDPILPSVASNLALLSVNLVLIALIVNERTTWRMSPEDRAIFAQFPTLNPGQFRRLRRMIQISYHKAGAVLARENETVDRLMLVLADRIEIEKGDQAMPIIGPAFVGEIAFLAKTPSSATVRLPDGGTELWIHAARLERAMDRSASFKNAMLALFSTELARKVTYSLPIEGRATAPSLSMPPVSGAVPEDKPTP